MLDPIIQKLGKAALKPATKNVENQSIQFAQTSTTALGAVEKADAATKKIMELVKDLPALIETTQATIKMEDQRRQEISPTAEPD